MDFIFIDNTSSQIVDVLRDRRRFKFHNHLFAYPLKTYQKLKKVTMQMHMPCIEVVREVFPNAKIIIDCFHLVQPSNRELNKLRIDSMNSFRVPDHRLYNKNKGYWRLFLMSRET